LGERKEKQIIIIIIKRGEEAVKNIKGRRAPSIIQSQNSSQSYETQTIDGHAMA
jgi:hypothetical protein